VRDGVETLGHVGCGPLAAYAEDRHNVPMRKPRITFKFDRVAEGDWQIEAHFPGAEIRYIRGFKTKAEVDEWAMRLKQRRLAGHHR
jgi:hypothetical protein